MTDVINTLMNEVKKHRTKLEGLEKIKMEIDQEIPLVRANLDALTRSLSIIQGTPIEDNVDAIKESVSHPQDMRKGFREGSMNALAYAILKEAGQPLRITDLYKRAKAKKPDMKKGSFTSGIYHLAKEKSVFENRSGKISLIE